MIRFTSASFISAGELLDPDAFMDARDMADLRRLAGLPVIGEDLHSMMAQQPSVGPAKYASDNIVSPVGTVGANIDKRKIEREKNLIPGTDEWFRLWFSHDDLTTADFDKNEKLGNKTVNTLMSTPPKSRTNENSTIARLKNLAGLTPYQPK